MTRDRRRGRRRAAQVLVAALPALLLGGGLGGAACWAVGCAAAAAQPPRAGATRGGPTTASAVDARPGPPAPTTLPRASAAAVAASAANSSDAAAAGASASPPGAADDRCPLDMVAVEGRYCTRLEQVCLRRRERRQCAAFEPNPVCRGPEVPLRYCIDRYEWPNRAGQPPKVMNSWRDARKHCTEVGKRLCTEDEWTLACEGPQRLGFPYGNVRDATACPFDKPSPRVNEARLYSPRTQQAELARLDQRDPSGSYARCVSPFGVHDMTGSVDEWVFYPPGKPYRSSLKGGNWGEYRNACRPVTRGHGEGWRYYQTGFRCCKAMREADG